MKQIKTSKGEFIFVECPKEAYDFRSKNMPDNSIEFVATIENNLFNIGTYYFNELSGAKFKYEFICTTDTITDEIVKYISGHLDFYLLYSGLDTSKTYAICKKMN